MGLTALLVYIQTYVCENVARTCKRAPPPPPFFFFYFHCLIDFFPLPMFPHALECLVWMGCGMLQAPIKTGINGKFQLLSTAKFKTKDWNSGYGHNKCERSWHVTEMRCSPELRLTPRAGLTDTDYYTFKSLLTWPCKGKRKKEKKKKKSGGGGGGGG